MLIRDLFDIYMRYGGMPGIADVGWEQERVLPLLEGIYSTVVIRDILEREKRRGQRQLTDVILLKKIILSLQPGLDTSYEGIRSLNLIDWLIERH